MIYDHKMTSYLDKVVEEKCKEAEKATSQRFQFLKDLKVLQEFTASFMRCWYEDEQFAISLADQMGLNEIHLACYRNDRRQLMALLEKDYEDCMGF